MRTNHRTPPRRDQKQARMAMLVAGALIFLVFVSCVAQTPDTTSASSSMVTSSTTAAAAAPPPHPSGNLPTNYQATLGYYVETADASRDAPADGKDTCQVGGETVVVTRAIDGDTVELADGRRVRILGVDAPEVGACGADAATAYTQAALVGNRLVVLHREPGFRHDQDGRELGYLQYVDTQYDTNKYWARPASQDLGAHLAIEARAAWNYIEPGTMAVDEFQAAHSKWTEVAGEKRRDSLRVDVPCKPGDTITVALDAAAVAYRPTRLRCEIFSPDGEPLAREEAPRPDPAPVCRTIAR